MSGAIRDQRKEALAYLEDKKVLRLFDALGVRLAQEKPESPNDFLISELRAPAGRAVGGWCAWM